MKTKLTFLGSGTSQGVPMIGCGCEVCQSTDPRDKRLRASVLVEYGDQTILVDAGPDFRQQMLRAGVGHLDAILLTHNHKDHTGGLDDVRAFNYLEGLPAEIYCEPYVEESLRKEYSYAFAEKKYPGAPEWHIHNISQEPFDIVPAETSDKIVWLSGQGYQHVYEEIPVEKRKKPVHIIPIRGMHYKLPVLGYRFGNIAYLTDIHRMDDAVIEKIKGVDYVTLGCVKIDEHYAHPSLQQCLDFFEKVGAKESYITHMSHLLPKHREFAAMLPDHVHPAYDGLVIE